MAQDDNLCWYHGRISREAAEQLLLSHENRENGLFLVRESNTAAGDYVLSVLFEGEVIHYQIRRHGEDAFFSIDEITITHGLETLIELYQRSGEMLVTTLTTPLKKDPPPHDSRRHGRTNLLHRATKEGNYTVASELLKCGYRSLEAKNEEGQTAVHLASRLGKNDILEKLINSGIASNCLEKLVNCRDSDGYTPLHYACQTNLPNTVRLLVESGKANVQIRNPNTGCVPLHEAASRGHRDVVQVLLNLHAPLRPRDGENQTPFDLATFGGHNSTAQLLANHKVPEPTTCKLEWYHRTLGRNEAVSILKTNGSQDGAYLVRYSDHMCSTVLTVCYEQQIYNYPIQKKDRFYFIDDGPLLDSLEAVVEHYSRWGPDGLPTNLRWPIPPTPAPPVPKNPRPSLFNGMSPTSTLPLKQHRSRSLQHVTSNTSTLPLPARNKSKPSPLSLPPNQSDGVIKPPAVPPLPAKYIPPPEEFIPSENLILEQPIGEGEFGSVYKGVYQTKEGFEEPVAIKTLRQEHVESNREEFVREAKIMMALRHHCIVRMIGLSEGPSLLMVQELVPLGSMLEFLQKNLQNVGEYELKVWASQIACGMQYLEEEKIVHRDLAARNILLASRHQAKISDFGLSRLKCGEREYYRATQGGRWPIKWYAPESYNYGKFTSASDVWSYGVTLWEMFSYGKQPYGDMKGVDVIQLVEKGERLDQPQDCPNHIYNVMERCWSYQPRDRPTFSELVDIFSSENNYTNVKELIPQSDIS
ncbi:tyrosine-protein kinase Shark [Macrosteles quadrilineatus]|uniref:tyrosine-protein kinase Shark n=1 Tax=Macrosteles quadrilineatus TaxID=74068 RepID=UPI0023E1852C|nr:tyrosine-protein kinase Shark [Macrosteles quadrilineatus]